MRLRMSRAGKAIAVGLLFGSVGAGLAANAAGPRVVVARSSDLGPYVVLEKAFIGALGQPADSISLAAPDGKARLKAALDSGAALMLAIGPDAARAAGELKPSCPTVAALVPDTGKTGMDAGTPVVPMFVPPARQLKAVRAALPAAKKLGILFDPSVSRALVGECEGAARAAGLTLVKKEVTSRKDVAGAARELVGMVDAIWLIPDTTVISGESFKFIMLTALGAKVPVVGFSEGMSKAGAVVSVEAEYAEMGVKAARVAQKLLSGQGGAPEAPEGAIYLNAKSAGLLGLSVSADVRAQATRVFE